MSIYNVYISFMDTISGTYGIVHLLWFS